MIKLKALYKASLVLVCLFFYSASNPAYAAGDYSNQTWNNDIDYYKGEIDESGIYEDSTLTDWHWMLAGDPNNGTDTLDDGFCFMYDGGNYGGEPFAIYNAIDIRQCTFYGSYQYQDIEWYNFQDLNLIAQPDTTPIGIYQDQQAYVGIADDETNIFGSGAEYWSGCYSTGNSPSWGAIGGGECPIINNTTSQINWGYMEQTLTQISAFDSALKNAGIETYGYTYSWMIKNADANREADNGADGQDTMTVTLSVKDNGGNTVYKKEFDYSYWIDTWTNFSGDENFDTAYDVSTLDSVMLEVTGQDVGNWDGYFGPEFNSANVKLKFRPIIEDNTEQLLFEQMCANDPMYDINCPGYQNAMVDQMNQAIGIENINGEDDTQLAQALDAGTGNFDNNMDGFEQETGVPDPVAEAQETGVPDPVAEAQETGVPDPVAEAVAADPVEEAQEQAVEQAAADPVEEAQEEAVAVAVAETTQEPSTAASRESKKATGLNATQLATLDAAQSVSASAEASASGSAVASAGAGLDANGGVSSQLTSVDPTGSTDATGQLSTTIGESSMSFATGSTSNMQQSFGNNNSGQATDVFGNPNNSGQSASNFGGVNDATGTIVDLSTGVDTDITVSTTFGQSADATTNSTGTTSNNMNTGDMQFEQTASIGQDSTGNETDEQFVANQTAQSMEDSLAQESVFNNDNAFTPGDIVDEIVMALTNNLITQAVADAEETAEESAEESIESQNAQEDALVAEALAGSDDEDAQSALLGYNPNFRAYQQPQMAGGDIYSNQGVYEDQKTYDSPRAGLFNGASDALHKKMVRQQYELGN